MISLASSFTVISPLLGVNLRALDRKLRRICKYLLESPYSRWKKSGLDMAAYLEQETEKKRVEEEGERRWGAGGRGGGGRGEGGLAWRWWKGCW